MTKDHAPSACFPMEKGICMGYFEKWNEKEQIEFVESLLSKMHNSHHLVCLKSSLQRDFLSPLLSRGLDHVAEAIFSYLDANSLCAAELVCKEWYRFIAESMLWKKLVESRVRTDTIWQRLAERFSWNEHLFKPKLEPYTSHLQYRKMHFQIIYEIERIATNWRNGKYNLQRINCNSEGSKGVYCLQYDRHKIVGGLRDNTLKIWDRSTLQCDKALTGHTGSVLCLQFDDAVIISGSSDSTIRVWNINTGEMINSLIHHQDAVLHLKFKNEMLVTCSKDSTVAVWTMLSPKTINLRKVLVGHGTAVNVIDFDGKYIISASGDSTIKIWNTSNCEFIRTLSGHSGAVACLQYTDQLLISGGVDKTIRLWSIERGV